MAAFFLGFCIGFLAGRYSDLIEDGVKELLKRFG
jgi:hypothetical protein